MSKKLADKVSNTSERLNADYAALCYLRYEYVRRLNPREFRSLYSRSLDGESTFDEIVDEEIAKGL